MTPSTAFLRLINAEAERGQAEAAFVDHPSDETRDAVIAAHDEAEAARSCYAEFFELAGVAA